MKYTRDQLLISASITAAYLDVSDRIYLPYIKSDQIAIADFITNAVADYIMTSSEEPFEGYIKEVLIDRFGTFISREEVKKREEPPHKCSTCRYDNDIYTRECNRCDWGEKWKPKGTDS